MDLDLVGHRLPVSHRSLLCFLGGADKNVIVFDKSSEQILATLKGHSKKVTSVVFHPSQVRLGPRSASSFTARLPQIGLSGPFSGPLFWWGLRLVQTGDGPALACEELSRMKR